MIHHFGSKNMQSNIDVCWGGYQNVAKLICFVLHIFYDFYLCNYDTGSGGGRIGLCIRSWFKHKSNELLQYNLNSNLKVISKNKLISYGINRHYAQYKCFIVFKIRLIYDLVTIVHSTYLETYLNPFVSDVWVFFFFFFPSKAMFSVHILELFQKKNFLPLHILSALTLSFPTLNQLLWLSTSSKTK